MKCITELAPAIMTLAIGTTVMNQVAQSLRESGVCEEQKNNKLKGTITMEDFECNKLPQLK